MPEAARPVLRGFRTVLFGTALVVLLSALTLHSNLRYNRYITASSLPSGAIFMFVAVMLGNAVARRLAPRWAFTVPELAILFSMLYVSAALPQAAVGETLVSLVSLPVYSPVRAPTLFAQRDHLPGWLTVQDAGEVARFYDGLHSGGGEIHWGAWAAPLAGWSAFVLLLLFALYCLSRIYTHRWIREERVSFPLMELPLELLNGYGSPKPIWRNPLMYAGAVIPASTILIGQLHGYYPFVPGWQQILSFPVGQNWTAPPWSALKEFTVSFWPLVIGISYFLSSEVAVSIWLFHLFFWAQLFFWATLGYGENGVNAVAGGLTPLGWVNSMEFGAAMALGAVMVWPIRGDVARAARALVRRERGGELPVPPWAVGGFLAGNLGMLAWAWAAGESPVAMGAFLVCLYAIVIALGRMVAAGGLYLIDNDFTPQGIMYGLAGARNVGLNTHYVLSGQEALFGRADMSFFYFATNDDKLAHAARIQGRWLSLGIAASVLAALVSAYVLILKWGYRYGAGSFGAWPFSERVPQIYEQVEGFLSIAQGPDAWTYAGVGAGMAVALGLVYLNRRFLWFAISPFGFVVGNSWNIAYQVWSSVFVGWLISALVRRYGGLKLYRALRPFFLGLILGDAVTYCLVALLESVIGVKAGG